MTPQAIDEPASRRPRRRMTSIHGVHGEDKAAGWRVLGRDFNQQTSFDVGPNHFGRHAAPAESGAKEGVFGPEIGEPPIPWRHDAEIAAFR